jgi:hypothetical protein
MNIFLTNRVRQHISVKQFSQHRRIKDGAINDHYHYCEHYDKKVRDKYKIDPESGFRTTYHYHFKDKYLQTTLKLSRKICTIKVF